jgi:hypothetical protein
LGDTWAGVPDRSGIESHRTGDVAVAIQIDDVTPSQLQEARAELERCEFAWNSRLREPGPLVDAAEESRKWERLYKEWKQEKDRIRKDKRKLTWTIQSLRNKIRNCELSLNPSFWIAVNPSFWIAVSLASIICSVPIALCSGHASKLSFGILIGFIVLCVCVPAPLVWFWSRRDIMQDRLVGLNDELAHSETKITEVEKALESANENLAIIRRNWDYAYNSYNNLEQLDPVWIAWQCARRKYKDVQRVLESEQWRLLHTDWRSLRGVSFENFLQRVFETQGYKVQTTRTTGDQGIDLVLTAPGKRIGVQAKGYAGNVGNDSVQQAFAGRMYYSCQSCVVITNSSFTASAMELASTVGCALIDGYRLPELIKGTIRL